MSIHTLGVVGRGTMPGVCRVLGTLACARAQFRTVPPQRGKWRGGGLPPHEYKVRVGAAVDVLRTTLPHFVETGLVERHTHGDVYHAHVAFRAPAWHGVWPTAAFCGRRKYLASAQLVRLALIGAFRETSIAIERFAFVPASRVRADELLVRLRVVCISRVGAHHDYVLLFRYTFDRASGTVCAHSLESMEPLPTARTLAGLAGLIG